MRALFEINGKYIAWDFFYWVRNMLNSEKAACELFFKCRYARSITNYVRWNIKTNNAFQKSPDMKYRKKKMYAWIEKHFSNIPHEPETVKTGEARFIEPPPIGNIKRGILA